MPYVLRYDASTGAPNMRVSRASSDARVVQYGDAETNGADKVRYYFSPFVSEFGLSAVESASQEGQIIVKESGVQNRKNTGWLFWSLRTMFSLRLGSVETSIG